MPSSLEVLLLNAQPVSRTEKIRGGVSLSNSSGLSYLISSGEKNQEKLWPMISSAWYPLTFSAPAFTLVPTRSGWQLRNRAAPFGSTQNYSSSVTKLAHNRARPRTYRRCVGREFKFIPAKRWLELEALSGVQCTTSATINP